MSTAIDLASRRQWTQEQLQQLTRTHRLTFQGHMLSLDVWSAVTEQLVVDGAHVRLLLTSAHGEQYLDTCAWCAPGWWLCGRVILPRSDESELFVTPQQPDSLKLRRWQKHWHVRGQWQMALPAVLEICSASADRANCFLKDWEPQPLIQPRKDELLACGLHELSPGCWALPTSELTESLELLKSCGWQLSYQRQPLWLQSQLSIEVAQEGSLSGQLDFEDGSIIPLADAWQTKQPLQRLSSGHWGLVRPHPMQAEVVASASGLRLRRTADPQLFVGAMPGGRISAASAFVGELRDYQRSGVEWMLQRYRLASGGMLADQMGLGKTVQVIAFLALLEQPNVLIVVPRSLVTNWDRELQKFLPAQPRMVFAGQAVSKLPGQHMGVVITTYGTVRTSPQLQNIHWDCLVLDEAQVVKNHRAQTTQAVHQLRARAKFALTGTPIENHLDELWTHLSFLEPDAIRDDLAPLESARYALKRVVLRRKKQDVLTELPPLIEQALLLPMSAEQTQLYQQVRQDAKQGESAMHLLTQLLRMRQICCDPRLVNAEILGAKLQWLEHELQEALLEQRAVLVFSQFSQLLKLAQQHCCQPCGLLTGETKDRQAVVDRFQSGALSVLFCSLKAAGVGLNLQRADQVIILDPWWNSAAEQQAIDRAHRIGRHDPVIVKRLIMADSVEERVQQLQHAKHALSELVLDGSDFPEQLDVQLLQTLLS